MRRQQIYLLLAYILSTVCLCKTIDGSTTAKPRMDKVEGLEGQFAEMQEILQSYMAKVNELEGMVRIIANHSGSVVAGLPGLPGPAGRDGRDGRDGVDGKDGADGGDGVDGEKGEHGEKGADGEKGQDGSNGRDGRDGLPGPQGLPGDAGSSGAVGPKGDRGSTGPQAGGATYTRWGRTTCGSDSTLVYAGFMGRERKGVEAGGINYQCMVIDAEYNSNRVAAVYGTVAGTEYETSSYGIFNNEAHNQNAPCAVCYANSRTSTLMVPGKRTCPADWHKEYEGYLMSSHSDYESPSTFECVDETPEYIRGEAADNNGGQLFFNRAICAQGVHCPEYNGYKAITCVVCTN